MTDETAPVTDDLRPEDIRTETAADAPELAEADRAAGLEAQVEELKKQVLYGQAELQNVRRRLEKDIADTRAYAATGFARDMLSVADNLARALQSMPAELKADEKLKPLLTGIEMTGKELESVFQRNGIVRIESVGAKLDPNRHQAMLEMPSDQEPGTIVQEMQAGYTIKDRLLRPAMVGVAKAG